MKKKFAVVLSVLIVLSAVVLTGSAINKTPAEEKQNPTTVAVNKSTEVAKISLDDAIDIALKDAGVKREDVLFHALPELDKDERNPHYDVEFFHNGVEYSYEIAVDDGAILKVEKEQEKPPATAQNKVEEREKKTEKAPEAPTTTKKAQQKQDASHISIEQAKEKALNDAGVKAADAVFKKAYYDADDLVAHFDIKFVAGGYEYEYEIKASNGAVLEKDIDRESKKPASPEPSTQPAENNYIGKDQALSIALTHAKLDSAQVKYSKTELDRDDLIVHYEVSFVSGVYEYEYEINAKSGKIIAFDKEIND